MCILCSRSILFNYHLLCCYCFVYIMCFLFVFDCFIYFFYFFFFFFFQAEDGIRDDLETGVQTCALPILFMQAVGGAQSVVMGYLLSISRVSIGLNLPRASCMNIAAPMTQGPKRLLQAAFAHPISDRKSVV